MPLKFHRGATKSTYLNKKGIVDYNAFFYAVNFYLLWAGGVVLLAGGVPLGGAVGTGLIIGSGTALVRGGPLGMSYSNECMLNIH